MAVTGKTRSHPPRPLSNSALSPQTSPPEYPFKQLVEREEVVVGALVLLELNIDIHVAVHTGLAPGKRAKHTHSPRSELAEFSYVILNGSERI
jgi:hypothetical protein